MTGLGPFVSFPDKCRKQLFAFLSFMQSNEYREDVRRQRDAEMVCGPLAYTVLSSSVVEE